MKNTIAILAFCAIACGISGCMKVSEDSDEPPKTGTEQLDSLSVPQDTTRPQADTLPRDTIVLRSDTVNFQTLPVSDAVRNVPELKFARTKADSIVTFAKKYIGTPYEYGSCEAGGFDCSGFIFYVFKNFGMELPRSSAAMAPVGKEVPLEQARKGDLIFFTGTDPLDHSVGHAGIVINESGQPVEFIHSSSDEKNGGVKITNYAASNYDKRFLKVKRIL
jgi:cell wall-associated NlpC family hydrolase